MNRHLDRTYVENDVPKSKEGYLVIDFFVFFLEACLLLWLASLVGQGDHLFLVLTALLLLDALWCIVTHGIHYSNIKPSTITWGWINIVAALLLLFFYFLQLFPVGATRSWALFSTTFVRTLADYTFCWRFYFPAES